MLNASTGEAAFENASERDHMYQLRIMSRAERGRLLQAEYDVGPEADRPSNEMTRNVSTFNSNYNSND